MKKYSFDVVVDLFRYGLDLVALPFGEKATFKELVKLRNSHPVEVRILLKSCDKCRNVILAFNQQSPCGRHYFEFALVQLRCPIKQRIDFEAQVLHFDLLHMLELFEPLIE